MKKKLTKLTKMFLVLCLVVSELSSVGLVFAEDVSTKFDSNININNETQYSPTITIKSNDLYEIKQDGNYKIRYKEEYTYLDETTENIYEGVVTDTDLAAKLNSEEGYLLTLYGVEGYADNFNGVYSITLELYEDDTLVDSTTLKLEYSASTELHTKVVMEREGKLTILEDTDGVVKVPEDYQDTDKLMLISILTTNELLPTKEYVINGQKYTGLEIVDTNFAKDSEGNDIILDYLEKIGGEYEYTTNITVENLAEEPTEYTNTIKVAYQDYAYNDEVLNDIANQTNVDLLFTSENNKEGYVYTKVLSKDTAMTVADVKAFLDNALTDEITYTLTYLDETEVLDTDVVSSNLVITLTSTSYESENTVTYTFAILGDTNNDGILDLEDVQKWLDDNYGIEDSEDLSLDIDKDGEVSLADLAHVVEVIKQKTWDVEPSDLDENDTIVDAKLTTDSETITTGDEFTVSYIIKVGKSGLSGFEGTLNYDKTKLELLGIEKEMQDEAEMPDDNTDYWVGKVVDGKFIYLTNMANGYREGEYEVLRLTFKAKEAADTTTITLDNTKYVVGLNDIKENSLTPLNITINASSNNNLKDLTVGDNTIELVEGVYEYTIEVENDIESIDVKATAENIGSVVSMDIPEKLSVGSNVIKITVVAENGETKDYFITVVRKEAEQEQVNIVPTNNTVNDNTPNEDKNDTPKPSDNSSKDNKPSENKTNNTSKYIIIVLIILVIIGLIYLIFKEDNEEKQQVNAPKNDKPKSKK